MAAVSLALVSCIVDSVQTGREKHKVATMTARMKTVCAGRFLIDVPVEAQVSLSHVFAGGLHIASSDRASDRELEERMRQSEQDMESALNEDGHPSLAVSKALVVGAGQGKIFIHDRRRSKLLKEHGFVVNDILALTSMPRFPGVSVWASNEWVGPAYIDRLSGVLSRLPPLEPGGLPRAFAHLREGQRLINGMQGEELVMRVREPNFTTGYAFQWETAGRQDDMHAPVLKLELESGTNPVSGGKPVQSTLAEEAVFELWERIVASIRARPTDPEYRASGQPGDSAAGRI